MIRICQAEGSAYAKALRVKRKKKKEKELIYSWSKKGASVAGAY